LQTNIEYLVNFNDQGCADNILLNSEEWHPRSGDATDFLAWAKAHLQAGHPVTMGVMDN